MLKWSRGGRRLKFLFTKHFNDWELEDVERLLSWLGLGDEVEDNASWMVTKDGIFLIKLMCKA